MWLKCAADYLFLVEQGRAEGGRRQCFILYYYYYVVGKMVAEPEMDQRERDRETGWRDSSDLLDCPNPEDLSLVDRIIQTEIWGPW